MSLIATSITTIALDNVDKKYSNSSTETPVARALLRQDLMFVGFIDVEVLDNPFVRMLKLEPSTHSHVYKSTFQWLFYLDGFQSLGKYAAKNQTG